MGNNIRKNYITKWPFSFQETDYGTRQKYPPPVERWVDYKPNNKERITNIFSILYIKAYKARIYFWLF